MGQHLAITIDVETTTYKKGNPYSKRNQLVSIGYKVLGHPAKRIRVLGMPAKWKEHFRRELQTLLRCCKYVVAFNAKFDIAWLRKFGIDFTDTEIWDCQLWEFLDSNQKWRYPDLATALMRRKLPHKLDIVKTYYWERGVDTPDIPKRVLDIYLKGDLESEEALFQCQYNQFRTWRKLFRLQCADLLVLQEMEQNGTLYNEELALESASATEQEVQALAEKLRGLRKSAWEWDFNSNDDTSVFLFGGKLVKEDKVCIGVYKSGKKAGQPRYKNVQYEFEFEPLIPTKDAQPSKKEGFYLANEPALLAVAKTKKVKAVVDLLLTYRAKNKLAGTYYRGLPKIREEMDWEYGTLYPNFNQCVVITGRLSSSEPNRQNWPSEVYDLLKGRF